MTAAAFQCARQRLGGIGIGGRKLEGQIEGK